MLAHVDLLLALPNQKPEGGEVPLVLSIEGSLHQKQRGQRSVDLRFGGRCPVLDKPREKKRGGAWKDDMMEK